MTFEEFCREENRKNFLIFSTIPVAYLRDAFEAGYASAVDKVLEWDMAHPKTEVAQRIFGNSDKMHK